MSLRLRDRNMAVVDLVVEAMTRPDRNTVAEMFMVAEIVMVEVVDSRRRDRSMVVVDFRRRDRSMVVVNMKRRLDKNMAMSRVRLEAMRLDGVRERMMKNGKITRRDAIRCAGGVGKVG
jgi:hypothetical protein